MEQEENIPKEKTLVQRCASKCLTTDSSEENCTHIYTNCEF